MASYTVPSGDVGAHAKTLTSTVVDTVTFEAPDAGDGIGRGRPPKRIEVLSDASADIYVTFDGSTPTVAGANCWRIPEGARSLVVDVGDADPNDAVVVKLISVGTPEYSVSRAS